MQTRGDIESCILRASEMDALKQKKTEKADSSTCLDISTNYS